VIRVLGGHFEAGLVRTEPIDDRVTGQLAVGHHPGVGLEVVLHHPVVAHMALAPLRVRRDVWAGLVVEPLCKVEALPGELVDPLVLAAGEPGPEAFDPACSRQAPEPLLCGVAGAAWPPLAGDLAGQ
jgi:hypothetical protein